MVICCFRSIGTHHANVETNVVHEAGRGSLESEKHDQEFHQTMLWSEPQTETALCLSSHTCWQGSVVVVVLVTSPLPRNWGMAGDHEAPHFHLASFQGLDQRL